ncbi:MULTISPECIES: conjugative transposon protein TraJ [Bacteroidaceae]|jgi:conjugative transposon TraJ protein|uniref:Conjugative transposon protein TraJ n=4 Tax=Bacteroidaceae TaxID=815 RepID=A0A413ZU38_BACSE|nr:MULTISPECIES: conjugative transposon protein TraJ [Bacteroidaceae]MCG0145072.1 conjugative transposon protein TraJ [Phocaeicola vulgatus]MDB0751411.1 conjugative transposon protein TraJ [Phocaeicola vulgatus]MDB0763248.1 conjugative transposon protein TraJ [Phocaeicola vulgatus]MDB0767393.1 conjugative transposon protein TraJ [Phocaeicola vulgatus]MDC1692894.1 conjugative transposon protein TraJ [Phocaeicola vulgatus]
MVLLSVDFSNLHTILESLYNEMMPLCGDMLDVAKGLAGLGALFYVAVRVWQSLARAEPIDVYPLLRPFAIGICIMLFPTLVLGTMNTVLSPIVQGTHKMLEGQTMDMQQYREQKDRLEREAMLRNPETAYLVSDEEFDRQLDELGWSPDAMATRMGMYMEVGMYNLEKNIRDAFRSLLELLFAAASLLIDTVRTFFLVVLSILGPIAFAFSVWDGFQSTLSQWFTRYISVYLWLPVSDLFSCMLAKIQVLMLQNDILELQNNPNYSLDNSNSVYVIFMLIGIIGYFTVPTVAGWIVQAGGAGNYNRNINRTATKTGGFAAGAAGSGLGNIGGRLRGK